MSYRRQASKPTAALWALVAAADAALLLAGVGAVALIALATLAVVAVAGVGAWRLVRHQTATSQLPVTASRVPVTVRMPARRP